MVAAPDAMFVAAAMLAVLVSVGLFTLVAHRLRRTEPPGLADLITAFAVLLWCSSVIALPLLRARGGDWNAEPDLLVAIAGTAGGAIASAAFIVARAPPPWLGLQRVPLRWSLVSLSAVPLFLLFSAGWVSLLEALGFPVEAQQLIAMVEDSDQPVVLGIALVYGVVGAPLAEEILFRGLFLGVLRDRLHTYAAIGVQALAFGLIHGADPAAIVPLAVLGAVLGWLRVKTGSLWPAVGAHAANNAVALGLAVIGLDF